MIYQNQPHAVVDVVGIDVVLVDWMNGAMENVNIYQIHKYDTYKNNLFEYYKRNGMLNTCYILRIGKLFWDRFDVD